MGLITAPPITGVSHIQLHVSDLDASVAWYTNALGLERLRGEPGRYIVMHSASGQFRVVLSTGGRPDNRGALNHVAFSVADVDALTAWADHLAAIGIAHDGVKTNPVGRSVDLFDPDGNNIELVAED